MKNKIIVITGPTASGKSSLAINLAREIAGEIISVDSMQLYKTMDIGTAKALPEERMGVPHHLIDILEPSEESSVAEYVALARTTAEDIIGRGHIPILVGGTTLYIQSFLDNIQFFNIPSDETLRSELTALAENEGNQKLWEMLNQIDPELAKELHYNNLGRIIRGIEAFKTTGKPLSIWQKESRSVPSPYDHLLLGLTYIDREILYNKINRRVDEMISDGLIEEVKLVYGANLSKTAKQAIGYKEIWEYLSKKTTLEEATEKLKMETRRYAKRQLTWMRSRKDINWLCKDQMTEKELIKHALKLVKKHIDN